MPSFCPCPTRTRNSGRAEIELEAVRYILDLSKMGDIDIIPMFLEVIRDQSPVAVVRLVFAAKQTSSIDGLAWNALLDAPLFH